MNGGKPAALDTYDEKQKTKGSKKMRVYCMVEGQYKGYRELTSFNPIVSNNWSKEHKVFPMYDDQTMQIFECGFNAQESLIVAYAEISFNEFKRKIESLSEKIIKTAISEAVKEASDSVSALYHELKIIEVLQATKTGRG